MVKAQFFLRRVQKYKQAIKDKVFIHYEHKTNLITTYSSYTDGNDLIYHLRKQLIDAGFVLKEREVNEVYERILSNIDDNYVNRFSFIAGRFISNFKINGFSEVDFSSMRAKTKNVRSLIFLDIIEKTYLYYQSYLKNNDVLILKI